MDIGPYQTDPGLELNIGCELRCSEPQHTKGTTVRACTLCFMPVCEGCVIKNSFRKNEASFQYRHRPLCVECWPCSSSHSERRSEWDIFDNVATLRQGDTCSCSANDGWLCLQCKKDHRVDMHSKINRCYRRGCAKELDGEYATRQICLWCQLPIPATRVEVRRRHDSQHLYAKFVTEVEGPGPPWHEDEPDTTCFKIVYTPQQLLQLGPLIRHTQKHHHHRSDVNSNAVVLNPPPEDCSNRPVRDSVNHGTGFPFHFERLCSRVLSSGWSLLRVHTAARSSQRSEKPIDLGTPPHAEPDPQHIIPTSQDANRQMMDEMASLSSCSLSEKQVVLSQSKGLRKRLLFHFRKPSKRNSNYYQLPG